MYILNCKTKNLDAVNCLVVPDRLFWDEYNNKPKSYTY